MGARGPKRSCDCADLIACMICRRREQQYRYANDLPNLALLPRRRIRESRLRLPDDPVALAYLAGLFDGEGCITQYASTNNWVVQIAMTDRDVIEYLASLGGSMRAEQPGGKRRRLYRWRLLAQSETQEFLTAVLPHLRVKCGRAQEALDELLALEHRFTQDVLPI